MGSVLISNCSLVVVVTSLMEHCYESLNVALIKFPLLFDLGLQHVHVHVGLTEYYD